MELKANYGGPLPSQIKKAYSPTASVLPILFRHVNHLELIQKREAADINYSIDSEIDLPSEGYTMEITEDLIEIVAKDEAGLFYGFVTLDQLIEDAKDQNASLPLIAIGDYPELAFRPIHWDIKHHREKESYYYALIDDLARQKINGVIVELEDKLKYERRPEVASADALTIQQWIDISNYAIERHISISPLVQGLGHASFILKHEKNKHLRDHPDSDWAFNPLDPETYELQYDLYLDAIAATPHGKYLHVGGDEVQTTGRGSNKSKLELNLIWLNQVTQWAEEHGRITIFWDDMPLKHAGVYYPMFNREISQAQVDSIWLQNESKLTEFIDQFPKNVIYMRWNYSSPETYGNLKTMDWFSNNGFQVMGATAGQTRWVLMPQQESNYNAIRSFALSSADKNFGGLLLTLWDDDSPHFELYKRGIATFAEYTWAGDQRDKASFKRAYRHRAFGSKASTDSLAFIDQLEIPVALWKNVLLKKGHDRNRISQLEDPIAQAIISLPQGANDSKWKAEYQNRLIQINQMLPLLDEIDRDIAKIHQSTDRNSYRLEVYDQVSRMVRQSFEMLIAVEAIGDHMNGEEIIRLRQEFESARTQFESVYAKTRMLNKPNGYILDQDHHVHLANQSRNMDWLFLPEMLLLDKMDQKLAERFPD